MKKILPLLFLFLPQMVTAKLHGQARLDSLVSVLNSDRFRNRNDSDKVALLNKISFGYVNINANEGLKYARQELQLAEDLGMEARICMANSSVATCYGAKSDYTNALKYYLVALQYAESLNDFQQMGNCNNDIGMLYYRLRDHEKALLYLRKAATIYEGHGAKNGAANSYVNIGIIYQEQGKFDSTLAFDFRALKVYEENGNENSAIMTLVNIANAYSSMKNEHNKAREMYAKALEKNKALNNVTVWENSYGSLGEMLYGEAGDTSLRLKGALKAAKLDSAKKYLDTAITFAEKIGDLDGIMEFRNYLYQAYMSSGNYKEALENYKEYISLWDSTFSNDNKLKIAKMETRREADLKQKQIELNIVSERKKKNERVFYVAGIGLLSLLVVAVARNANTRKKKNEELAGEKAKLEAANSRLAMEKTNSDNLAVSLQESIMQKDALTAQLGLAADMKTRFLANISHELRTPVTLLTGMLELMKDKAGNSGSGAKSGERLEVAYKNSRRLQYMVEEILDLSRLETSHAKMNQETREITPMVRRMVYAFETFIEKEHITLEFTEGNTQAIYVGIDENMLEKVVNNLVYNAIKFNVRNGWIKTKASVTADGKFFQFSISNSGSGIKPEDLPHVFERFYQGGSTTAGAEGVGIGLSLVKEFTLMMGGTVEAASSAEAGTMFTLRFPVTDAREAVKEREAETDMPVEVWEHFPERQTVLIVEDNAEMRYYLREVLGDKVNLAEADNGKEALAWLENNKADLVITDIMMPEMGGEEFIGRLKSTDTWKTIPVITLTALADAGSRLNMLRFGIDDYIVKPFNATELRVRVYNLLSNLEARKQFVSQAAEPDDVPVGSPEADEFRHKVTAFVLARMKTINVSVYDLAYELGMSERQLYRLAKSMTGCTPAQLVKEVRLQKAYELLLGGSVTKIEYLSRQVGFEDAAYFSRQFTERFGKRPTEFLS